MEKFLCVECGQDCDEEDGVCDACQAEYDQDEDLEEDEDNA